MPVIAVCLLVAVPSVTLTATSLHRRDPFRHRYPTAPTSPNPDCPKTLARHASPPCTFSQSASTLLPPHSPASTVPPRPLLSTTERPTPHGHPTVWPLTPRFRTLHTALHKHAQTLTCTSLTVTPSHSCRKRMHHIFPSRHLLHPLMYAHSPKPRTHTLCTPNGHAHPDLEVLSIPPLHTDTYTPTTLNFPPVNHIPAPPSHKKMNAAIHALLGNGGPVTRSRSIPPNPSSPDPLPNSSRPLKTPKTTPLSQSPGSSIAHLHNQDRTPPLIRPHPPAATPVTTRPTPNQYTRTHTRPQHTISSIIPPPPFLVNDPMQNSLPFNLDSHTDFPPILPPSVPNNPPTANSHHRS